MSRGFKIVAIFLFAILLLIQFIRPEHNSTHSDPMADMISVIQPPEHIENMLRIACYDCHSNQTRYPWYDKIQPVSWLLNNHIEEGKKELNFSGYGDMDKADRIRVLVKTCEVVEAGSMPLPSFMLFHKEARLSQEEKAQICKWADDEALKVMRE